MAYICEFLPTGYDLKGWGIEMVYPLRIPYFIWR